VEEVILPELGQAVEAGQPLFRLERQGCGLNVRSSITGRVVAVNTRLGNRPGSVAKDPYGSGWICAITPTQSDNSSGGMRYGQKAANWLEQEFHRFREFLSVQVSPDLALNVTYPDGGLPAIGSLAELPLAGWGAFEAAFLAPSPGDTREPVGETEYRLLLRLGAAIQLPVNLKNQMTLLPNECVKKFAMCHPESFACHSERSEESP
jgi:hypothetical protein